MSGRRTSKPLFRGLLLLAALLFGVGTASVPVAVGAEAATSLLEYPPVAAGSTSISFSGNTGISLRVTQETEIKHGVMRIQLSTGNFALAAVAKPGCPASPPVFADCVFFRLLHYPAYPYQASSWFLGSTPATVEPGTYDIYILSDGAGVLTLDLPNLDGALSLNAGGTIRGVLERFQPSCPDFEPIDPQCKNFGHGGKARDVGEEDNLGMVMAVTYAWVPRWDIVPFAPSSDGTTSARACVAPNGLEDREGSPEPEDHPHGCALMPTSPDWDDGTNMIGYFGGPVEDTAFRYAGKAMVYSWDAAIGKVYAGFLAKAKSYGEVQGFSGGYAAYGMWLTPGIVCESECQDATRA